MSNRKIKKFLFITTNKLIYQVVRAGNSVAKNIYTYCIIIYNYTNNDKENNGRPEKEIDVDGKN